MTTPARHALVIAAQCAELGILDELKSAAADLRDVLTHPWAGACERSPVIRSGLLYGDGVRRGDIDTAVREAAEAAAEAGAVLVLAFLGHGSTPGQNPTLYLMAGDSRADVIGSAVDVGRILAEVLETPGLPGLVAIVDTCHAGGATPDIKALDAGVRRGETRFSLLMSAGAAEEAYRLAFTTALVRVLEEGVAGAGEFLHAADVLDSVRELVRGQNPRMVEHDGARFGQRNWLSRNVRHFKGIASVLGRVATEHLEEALAPVGDPALPQTPVTDLLALERLREQLCRSRAGNAYERNWALRVVEDLRDVLKTVDLLNSWPGETLTTERLRTALIRATGRSEERLPNSDGGELLRDAVEFLHIRARRLGESRTARLAHFVASLATQEGLPRHSPALAAWARQVGAVVELGDAFKTLLTDSDRTRLRLIVSLHTDLAEEWPETLDAWLLDGGKVLGRKQVDCTPDQHSVEQSLQEVLHWASPKGSTPPRRVEIAAPAPLLLHWRPELIHFGELLGDRHDVVLRWSGRLCPPRHLWWINRRAREQLTAMNTCPAGRAPVDWLTARETGRTEELQARFVRRMYTQAIGLGHRPQRFPQVMDILLAYAPIVLWPGTRGRMPRGCRDSLDKYWHLLPKEFSEAYRRSWGRGAGAGAGRDSLDHLALWRSVWHDIEWLDFCDLFEPYNEGGQPT
ncbi:vWA-MoxR associated conflict system protein [Streptomyces cynarae]|uniref:vWA-MoxR associated conflict system protein n=1 Tax=Streptomyces cynarae TaxID=2981134 RepID=UPI00406C3D13